MDILTLRKILPNRYFDYQKLKAAITNQANQRRFIGNLIKKGLIIRVKKGLYIWGRDLGFSEYSKEILANLIYGPSYVSLEYALSVYGLIPERVETVTSVTCTKNKIFHTPVGLFAYAHLHISSYPHGVTLHIINNAESFLIATPEKALLDFIALRTPKGFSHFSLAQLIHDDLRIGENEFASLNMDLLHHYGTHYKSTSIKQFLKMVQNG